MGWRAGDHCSARGLLKWVIMLSPLAFVLVLSFGINKLSTGTAQVLYLGLRGR